MAKIVIQLDPDGGAPTVTSDEPVEVVILRYGKDLSDYEDHDVFEVPCRDLINRSDEAVGHIESSDVQATWVDKVFSVLLDRANKEARQAKKPKSGTSPSM